MLSDGGQRCTEGVASDMTTSSASRSPHSVVSSTGTTCYAKVIYSRRPNFLPVRLAPEFLRRKRHNPRRCLPRRASPPPAPRKDKSMFWESDIPRSVRITIRVVRAVEAVIPPLLAGFLIGLGATETGTPLLIPIALVILYLHWRLGLWKMSR